jgi:hypothetical protein
VKATNNRQPSKSESCSDVVDGDASKEVTISQRVPTRKSTVGAALQEETVSKEPARQLQERVKATSNLHHRKHSYRSERSEIYATMKQSWQSEEAASRHSSPGKPIANTDEINLERAISLHHNEGYSQLQQLQPAITSFAQKCFPSSAHHEGEARIEEALLPGFVHHASSDEQDSPDEEIECHPHPLQETDWTAYC